MLALRQLDFCAKCGEGAGVRLLENNWSIPVVGYLNRRSACCNTPLFTVLEVIAARDMAFDPLTYPLRKLTMDAAREEATPPPEEK